MNATTSALHKASDKLLSAASAVTPSWHHLPGGRSRSSSRTIVDEEPSQEAASTPTTSKQSSSLPEATSIAPVTASPTTASTSREPSSLVPRASSSSSTDSSSSSATQHADHEQSMFPSLDEAPTQPVTENAGKPSYYEALEMRRRQRGRSIMDSASLI